MIRRDSFLRIHQQHPEIKQMKTWKRTAITLSIHLSSKCSLNFSCKERKTNLIFVFTEKLDPEFRQEPQQDCAEVPPEPCRKPTRYRAGISPALCRIPLPVNSFQAFENDWNLTESGRVLNIALSTALAEFPRPCLPKPYL